MLKRFWLLLLILGVFCQEANAFWMWTPESGKWVNPKYAVKDTPKEQLAYALEFYQQKDYKKAAEEFNKLLKTYPRAREAPEAQYYIGLSLEEQDKLFEAFKAYQLVIEKYPFSERSGEIVEKQFRLGERIMDGGGRRSRLVNTIVGGDYDVVEIFRAVIKNAPYGVFAAQAQYKIGLYLHEKQLFQEARDEFEKVINDYPESEWAKAAQYQIALVDASRSSSPEYDQKTTQAAVEEFKSYVKENPSAELSRSAQKQIFDLRQKEAENSFLVAHFYEKQRNFKAAKIYYSAVVDNYKNTVWATKALEKIRDLEHKIK